MTPEMTPETLSGGQSLDELSPGTLCTERTFRTLPCICIEITSIISIYRYYSNTVKEHLDLIHIRLRTPVTTVSTLAAIAPMVNLSAEPSIRTVISRLPTSESDLHTDYRSSFGSNTTRPAQYPV